MEHILDRKIFKKGSVILRQGDEGSSAYLIQSGRVRIYAIGHNAKMVDLGKLGPGQFFGEMALFGQGIRSATVEADEDTTIIEITQDILQEKLRKSDPTIRALMPMLQERLMQSNAARLKHEGTPAALKENVERAYSHMRQSLPPSRQSDFDSEVKPALEAFLAAVTRFKA